MTTVSAAYYDGKSPQKREVRIHFDSTGRLRITDQALDLSYTLSEVRITPRIGNTPRSIYLPGGAKCETPENDAIDTILQSRGKGRWQLLVHKFESRLNYVLPALVATVIIVWGTVEYGLPALSKRVASATPASVDAALGREGLAMLDRILFSPSDLDEEERRRVQVIFRPVAQATDDPRDFRLEFRRGQRVGANAFAFPSGIVVVTDDLVRLARHQNELTAVLAHEIGHVIYRHALRQLLQNSAVVLVIASITGDITSLTSLSAALPTMLIEANYSRTFEREADQFAVDYLRANHIPPSYFADILLRLDEERGAGDGVHNYLDSHPATSQRIQMLRSED